MDKKHNSQHMHAQGMANKDSSPENNAWDGSSKLHIDESYKFGAEVDKILHMMINSIYTNKDIFLRELISNASDACDKLRSLSLQDNTHNLQDEGEVEERNQKFDTAIKLNAEECQNFFITITIDKANQTIAIEDNGIGMNRQELIDNLGTIASSGTQKFLANLASGMDKSKAKSHATDESQIHSNKGSDQKSDSQLIGQFGVGFYAAFMVADSIDVYSTSAIDHSSHLWSSNGKDGFTISDLTTNPSTKLSEHSPKRGTIIVVKLKPSEVGFLDSHKIKHIVKTYSDHIAFPITLVDEDGQSQLLNSSTALWMRPKDQISEKDYKDFYHNLSHMPDEPWMIAHNKIEGHIDYTSLLYIPGTKPYDLFHPDRKARVKLYIKRVFITDDGVQIIPPYLRFLRGIIDSEDLPLNISREILQHNSVITKIRKSIVNRLLRDLKKKSESDAESFGKFWQNFGEVMKEGLCEAALEEKEQLLEVCKFYSTNSGERLIGLDEYINNMIDGQEEIFFLTGTNIESLKQSPELEGFTHRNIDVLLLHDYVDDFWVNVINQYKNKELKSITSPNIDLDKIRKIHQSMAGELSDDHTETSKQGKLKKDSHKDKSAIDPTTKANNDDLIRYISVVLGDRVRSVQISNKLINSPACLALPEGSMNARMEKMLIAQKQLNRKSSKILEINPTHPLMMQISRAISNMKAATMRADEKADQKSDNAMDFNREAHQVHDKAIDTKRCLSDLIEIIFDQARLMGGEDIENPREFANKMNGFLLKVEL